MAEHKIPSLVAAVALCVTTLVGCSSNEPEVCTNLDALDTSIDKLDDISVDEGGLSSLESQVATIREDLDAVKASAQDEFSTEIGQVQSAADTLRDSLTAAKSDPSVSALAVVGDGIRGVDDAISQLDDAADATC